MSDMTNKDVYDSAIRLLAESVRTGDNDDYEERAPFLLATFCAEAEDIDAAMRRALALPSSIDFNGTYLPLEAEFPLLPRFRAAASLYLAAMLVLEDDAALSDRLYDKYSDAMARICTSIPSLCEKISNRYFYN